VVNVAGEFADGTAGLLDCTAERMVAAVSGVSSSIPKISRPCARISLSNSRTRGPSSESMFCNVLLAVPASPGCNVCDAGGVLAGELAVADIVANADAVFDIT